MVGDYHDYSKRLTIALCAHFVGQLCVTYFNICNVLNYFYITNYVLCNYFILYYHYINIYYIE